MNGGHIVIIGGGIAGASAAWWLARGGASHVTLLEKERGFGMHSSGLNAAILRTAATSEATRRLARETAAFLRDPPARFSAVRLLDPCGVLVFEGSEDEALPAWAEELLALGEVERLELSRAAELAPHFRPKAARAWLFPREGRIDISALLDGFLAGARAAGAKLVSGAQVAELLVSGGAVHGVRLADGERIEADWTVLAAGGWAGRLAPRVGGHVRLRPTRRHLLVTRVDPGIDCRWPIVWDERAAFYSRPESGGLLLCACDESDVDPDTCAADPAVKLSVARKARALLPRFGDARVTHFWAGVRTLTEDGCPVVGPDEDVPGLFWIAGLGGHGMSTSAAVGRIAAEQLLGEAHDEALAEAVRPGRFAPRASRAHGTV